MTSMAGTPVGYVSRPCTLADLAGVLALITACEIADYGESEETAETLRDHWKPISLESDSVVVIDDRGALAAYCVQPARNPVRLEAILYVHPQHAGRGIRMWLTEWAHSRATKRLPEAPEGLRVSLEFGVASVNEAGIRLLQDCGYSLTRHFLRMMIELGEAPAEPSWPGSVGLRGFVVGDDDYGVYKALDEAFQDAWGHVTVPFETSIKRAFEQETFDPTLWFLATDGEEIAGASLCSVRGDHGWVNTLGVRRPWRRRGVGQALLQHSFGELYRRGTRRIGLGVDADSLTGATRLYERVGMHADRRYSYYSKELRPGREIVTRTLEDEAH